MPQLVALALVGAGLFAGYRWMSRLTSEARDNLRKAEAEARRRNGGTGDEPRDLGALEWDSTAEVYRPRLPKA